MALVIFFFFVVFLHVLCGDYASNTSVYIGAKTVVRTVYGNSNGFELKVSMHPTLSPSAIPH